MILEKELKNWGKNWKVDFFLIYEFLIDDIGHD